MSRLILEMCLSEVDLSHLIYLKSKCSIWSCVGQIFFAREGLSTELAS